MKSILELIRKGTFLSCNEPCARAEVLDILLKLRNEFGASILLINHDLSVASYMCDRIAVIYLGEIVEIGPADSIVNNPIHPYTRALFESVPKRARAPTNPIIPPIGCRFNPRCPCSKENCKKIKLNLEEYSNIQYVACHQ